MYEAPIKMIQHQLEIKEENGILQAVKEVGVVVDKEELIKALKYDRGQYDKGYSDGIKDFAEMFYSLLADYADYDTLYIYEIKDRIDIVEEMTGGNNENTP